MEQIVKNIFNDLSDRFNMDMNHVSLTQLLFCLNDTVNGTKITKVYEGYSPMEFLTRFKIDLMCKKGEIDLTKKIQLDNAYYEYNRSIKRIYNAELDLKHEFRSALSNGDLTIEGFNALVDSHISYWEDWKQRNEEILAENSLPITFDLAKLIDNYNGVTTDYVYQANDEIGITYKEVKKKFEHILYNLPVSKPLDQIVNPTKNYGEYASYSVIEFLNIYKIQQMHDNGDLTDSEELYLLTAYKDLVQATKEIAKTENQDRLPGLVARQKDDESILKQHSLPLEFDLDGIIDSYGKDKNIDIQKVK